MLAKSVSTYPSIGQIREARYSWPTGAVVLRHRFPVRGIVQPRQISQFRRANPSQFRGTPTTAAHSALTHDVGLPYRIGKTIYPADSAEAQTVVNRGASVRAY